MKRLILCVSASIAMLLGTSALAFSMGDKPLKVGTIDMAKVFASPQVRNIQQGVSKQFAGQRSKLVTLQKKISQDQAAMKKNAAVMSATDKAKKVQAIKTEQQSLQAQAIQFQRTQMAAQSKALKTIVAKVKAATKTVATKLGLKAVFVNNAVLYAQDSQDITADVVKNLK